ncbi:MAG: alpha/beta hydrolase [Pseudomonadota bacterium]
MQGCNSGTTYSWDEISTQPIGDLTETVWNLARYPFGPYDKIGARRLVQNATTGTKAVVVYLPPSFTNAKLYPDASLTNYDENYDFRLYLANRGYEIFSLDYRTSFVPSGAQDLSSMATWGNDVFIDDIQSIIEFAKVKTGASKVFIAGHSSGGHYVYLYAAERWNDDLSGMIILDSAPWETDGAPTSLESISLNEIHAKLDAGNSEANRAYFQDMGITADPVTYYNNIVLVFGDGFDEAVRLYYDQGPTYGPYEGFNTVTDYLADQYQNAWGDAQLTNVENNYSTVGMLLAFNMTTDSSYWPLVDYAEETYIGNWDGDTPTGPGYHLRENLGKVDIPIIVFASQMWTDALGMNFEWKAMGPTLIKSTDREYHLLEGFGHLDVLIGEDAKEFVYQPLYDWLEARR